MNLSPRLLLLALALAAAVAPPAPAAAQGQVSGTFHVVWGVPPKGATPGVTVRFRLVDDAGQGTELLVDEALMRPHGGPLGLDRRRVTVTGTQAAAPRRGGAPALRVGSIRPAPGGPSASVSADARSGTYRYVTILCKFNDTPAVEPRSKADYQAWVAGSGGASLDHYWREASWGQINLSGGLVVGWYVLPYPRSHYVKSNGANLDLLAADCTAAADADVVFTDYYGINMQFNQDLDNASWGGSHLFILDGATRIYGTTWMAEWAEQSTYVHESGHSLGLPHSSGPYTSTYDSRWDVMSDSYLMYNATYDTYLGQHTVGYHKDLLAWIPADRKYVADAPGSSRTLVLERSALPGSGNFLLAQIPISSTSEFYTVEARGRVGLDQHLPGDAVVIHRVNPSRFDRLARVVDADGNGNPNDEGAMWRPGETFRDEANAISVTVNAATATGFSVTISRVSLVITTPAARPAGVVGVPYTDQLAVSGGSSPTWALSGGTLPPGLSLAATGAVTGTPTQAGSYNFTATVTSSGATATRIFSVQVFEALAAGADSVRPAAVAGSPYADQLPATGGNGTYAWAVTSGALPPGLALSAAGQVAGTPTQAGTFRLTATVQSAGLQAAQRVVITVHPALSVRSEPQRRAGVMGAAYADTLQAEGGAGGAVTWSITGGALPEGVTLDAATGVLSGVPAASGTFAFTATATSGPAAASRGMALVVTRPVLAVDGVIEQLLGAGTLTADQVRFLDLQGNRNGRLDVGDVRAWLAATGQVSPVKLPEP